MHAALVIECLGGVDPAGAIIKAALAAGKYVVSANKAAVAAHWIHLKEYAQGENRRLFCSATVGGAMPALEIVRTQSAGVIEIRGAISGTCNAVLEAWSAGMTIEDAVAAAQEQGYAESDPTRDLSGRDSADKLSLLIEAAFGEWMPPEAIECQGLEGISGDPNGYKLIARARRVGRTIVASVRPERMRKTSFLAPPRGAENRLEIMLETGETVRLMGKGAGRWPTTLSVLGDLHEIARMLSASGIRSTGENHGYAVAGGVQA